MALYTLRIEILVAFLFPIHLSRKNPFFFLLRFTCNNISASISLPTTTTKKKKTCRPWGPVTQHAIFQDLKSEQLQLHYVEWCKGLR